MCLAGCYHASHGAVRSTARSTVGHRGQSWHRRCPLTVTATAEGARMEKKNPDARRGTKWEIIWGILGSCVKETQELKLQTECLKKKTHKWVSRLLIQSKDVMTLQGRKISPCKLRPEEEAGEWSGGGRGFGLFHLLVFAPPLPPRNV